jgi:hypothetical protein
MGGLVINSGGLGTYMRNDCSSNSPTMGQAIDCDSITNFFNPTCWGLCGPGLNIASPVAPSPSNLNLTAPGVPDATGDAGQDESNAALLATQAANAALNPPGAAADSCESFTATWPYPFDGMTCTTVALYGALAFAAILILPRLLK